MPSGNPRKTVWCGFLPIVSSVLKEIEQKFVGKSMIVGPSPRLSKSVAIKGLRRSSERLNKHCFITGCHCSQERCCLGFSLLLCRALQLLETDLPRIGDAFAGTDTAVRAVQQSLNVQGGFSGLSRQVFRFWSWVTNRKNGLLRAGLALRV